MKVKVSPHYHGNGWYDPRSGVNFFKWDGEISIPEGVDMSNINRYISLNYLVVIEDNQPEPMPELVVQTPGQLLAEEKQEVVVEEEPVEVEIVESETVEEENIEEEASEEEDKHICQFCGRELKTAGGKASHEKACKENPDNK